MQDLGNTQFFKVEAEPASSVEVILQTVFEVMKEKGYKNLRMTRNMYKNFQK